MNRWLRLIKIRMIVFVLISGAAGFAFGRATFQFSQIPDIILFLIGLFGISAGSFGLNQIQETAFDRRMKRTRLRPLITGEISLKQASLLCAFLMTVGLILLYRLTPLAALLGALSILLYNGPYTLWWKRYWAYGAIPGALPGTGPVVIGIAASGAPFWTRETLFMFLLLFLWQMPHFWTLAIRYREDYRAGGFPVLPTAKGTEVTLIHMSIYLSLYLTLATLTPFFIPIHWILFSLILIMSFKVLYEFFRFSAETEERWLNFFSWVNGSILFFLFIPIFSRLFP